MWFDGMGTLMAVEYIENARGNIREAIQSFERDHGLDSRKQIKNLKAALALLSI